MAFIENTQDNFRPSNNPWGDDNITIYKQETPLRNRNNISMSSDNELKNLMIEMTEAIRRTPPCQERVELAERLGGIVSELKQREKVSPLPKPVQEVVKEVESKYDPSQYLEDCGEDERELTNEQIDELEIDELDELSEVEEEITTDKPDTILGMDFNNFLIGALIVITLISVTRKK
jgi:hypothetical protein